MNYKAQLLHLKAQRKRRKHERVSDVELPGRNIDVISRLIDYQLDHIAITGRADRRVGQYAEAGRLPGHRARRKIGDTAGAALSIKV